MRFPKNQLRLNEESLRMRVELEKHIQEVLKGLHEEMVILETQLERTALAMQYEKENNVQKAVKLYQKNVDETALDPYSYGRLAILYRKMNQPKLEIKTLEKALIVFEELCFKKSSAFSEQLLKLQEVVEQTRIISDSLNDSDSETYGEQLDFFKKRLDEAYKKSEKS